MRYFGPKSLSSILNRVLGVSWYLVIAGFLFVSLILFCAMFSVSFGDPFTAILAKGDSCEMRIDDPDWTRLMAMPAICRAIVFPYLAAVTFLLLRIVRKSQKLFENFQAETIFRKDNAAIIRSTSYLLIGFSVLTFNLSTLLVSLILLVVCEILRTGTALQEEQDLTV